MNLILRLGKREKCRVRKEKHWGFIWLREYNGRMYESVAYNKNTQKYVVELIRKLVEE